MADSARIARLDEAALLMQTFTGAPFGPLPLAVAWRQASWLLYLRWQNAQGEVDLEKQAREPPTPSPAFAWLRRT